MDIRCEKCGTRYVLDDQRVPAGGTPVRCSTCGSVFHVHRAGAPLPGGVPAGTPGPAAPYAGTPGPAGAGAFDPGQTALFGSAPAPAVPPAPAPRENTVLFGSAPAAFAPPPRTTSSATMPAARPDRVSVFEESFGVAPSDPEERSHTHPLVPESDEPDLRVLRPGGLGRFAMITVGLLVAATAVIYLLFRETFDPMLGIGTAEVPVVAVAKLEQARAASRLDTLTGYQQAVKTAQDAIRLAGEVPFPDAWSRIALAYVGWADLMNQRAKRHQATADAIALPPVGAVAPPTCCPADPAARTGLDALCAPRAKGGRPCSELEEAARAAALDARDDATSQASAAKEAKEKAEANAIRDRADARERLSEALNAARRARSMAPASSLAAVALAAHARAGGDTAGFTRLATELKQNKELSPPPELLVQEALAAQASEGLAMLQKVTATDPSDARVQWLIAERAEEAGDDALATTAAEKAVALSPEHEAARGLLRVLSLRARRGAAAVEATGTP